MFRHHPRIFNAVDTASLSAVAFLTVVELLIAARVQDAFRTAIVGVGVAVIAGFKPAPNDTITAPSCDATVEAAVVVGCVAIVALLFALSKHAITAASDGALVGAVIACVGVAIVTGFKTCAQKAIAT